MNNVMNLNTNEQMTMSSLEIADLVESRHDNVKRAIERLVERGVIQRPPMEEVKNHIGQKVSSYQLTKRDSYVVVAQLSPEFTARLVDRWQELEHKQIEQNHQKSPEPVRPMLPVEAAGSTFETLLKVAKLAGLSENPALLKANKGTSTSTGIDFFDLMQIELKTEDDKVFITPTQIGKEVGLSAVKVNKTLESMGYQARINGTWVPTDEGKPLSQVTEVQRSNSSGTSQQVKWSSELIGMLK